MKLFLVFLIILIIIVSFANVACGRGGRGGGARISVRYSSSRYSYSYRSYRNSYSSYRYSYGSFRTSSYSMAPDMLRRKGGFYGNKQLLFLGGTVYIAHSLRPRFYYKERGWGYSGDYDEFAVCIGNVTAKNAQNVTSQFMYFVCPSDVTDIFKYDDKYCCGDPKNQFCCDEQGFYDQYGTATAAASTALIAVVTMLFLLCTCGLCGLMIYLIVRRRMQQVRVPVPHKAVIVTGAAAAEAPAYPLSPMQPPQGAAYPTQPSAYPQQPAYPESQPMLGPEGAPGPYPSYMPQPQQPMPPGVQPPPYPGPM